MLRKRNSPQKRLILSPANRGRTVVTLGLLLTLILGASFFIHWQAMPATKGTPALSAAKPTMTMPQGSPSPPLILSKEYIYDGSKLLATRETPLLEGDVSKRPEGDGRVTVSDWVQVGRFAAGLDTPTPGPEFQRGDCAPRSISGNGGISISDWVQAGRYAAGLDPPQYAAGPNGIASSLFGGSGPVFALALPSGFLPQLLIRTASVGPGPNRATARVVRIVSPSFVAGQNGTVTIELDSQGDENAVGMSLTFNTSQLTFVSAVKGSDASSASLNVNSSSASSGRVGIALALSSGQTFTAGTRQWVVVTFTASASGSLFVSSGDQPVFREVADVNANPLAATFTP